MKIREWIKKTSSEERRQVAKKAGCTSYYFYHVANNGCGVGLAKKIEVATRQVTPGAVVLKSEIRPDVWGDDCG
ncbi:MAG: hypothetical protein U9Q89_05350 [Thermodesulfobacteriota bacterium]|nr:hypothetical protein [Thermodesulfobacteriota bacterium]